jgi:hypothetical protein
MVARAEHNAGRWHAGPRQTCDQTVANRTEAESWIADLDAADYATTERILNDIGAENFLRYWRVHRDAQQDVYFPL